MLYDCNLSTIQRDIYDSVVMRHRGEERSDSWSYVVRAKMKGHLRSCIIELSVIACFRDVHGRSDLGRGANVLHKSSCRAWSQDQAPPK